MPTKQNTIGDLEQSAVEKYEDLLDTILVVEAMKDKKDEGKTWKDVKAKFSKNV